MEDIQGDLKYGCKTMPIVWGIDFTKIFTGIWMVILLVLLFIVFYYILQLRMWIPALYEMVLIILPAGYTLKLLIKAETTLAFAKISFWIKIFILTGILSMLFFKFY
jgi:4-hydroxybenzoate polyprenyltransferase